MNGDKLYLSLSRFVLGAAMILSMGGCEIDRSDTTQSVSDAMLSDLVSASQRANVVIADERVFGLFRADVVVVTAPVAGWEDIPATELVNGVDYAFAYISVPDPEIPEGYYTLRAFANPTGVGEIAARVQLIDEQGSVTAEVTAETTVHSMTVPEDPAYDGVYISTVSSVTLGSPFGPPPPDIIWFRCANGVCIRHPLTFGPVVP